MVAFAHPGTQCERLTFVFLDAPCYCIAKVIIGKTRNIFEYLYAVAVYLINVGMQYNRGARDVTKRKELFVRYSSWTAASTCTYSIILYSCNVPVHVQTCTAAKFLIVGDLGDYMHSWEPQYMYNCTIHLRHMRSTMHITFTVA